MLSSAARRLIRLYAVKPGLRAVVFSANAEGDAAISDLEGAGVEIARVVDARRGERIARAVGAGGVRRVDLGDGTRVEADLLVTAVGWTAATALLSLAGARIEYDPHAARSFARDLPDDVLAAGGVTGDGSLEQILEQARAVGREAARRAFHRAAALRRGNPNAADSRSDASDEPVSIPRLAAAAHPELFDAGTGGFVDFSEDVSTKDVIQAVDEGFDSLQLAKRFTTATMGPAQGKLELVNTAAVHAKATGQSIASTGSTTWRPPCSPIALGALAGRSFEPTHVSPLQAWHRRRGAHMLVAGQWLRPEHYGDPAAEVRNVRENVGIIDVTPLGKIDLRGPDVPHLLNLLYVNKWSQLRVGAVRYGVMCGEDGVVLDDGVTGRLGEEHYLMTTTSSGAAGIVEWVEDWLQTAHPEWRVLATPVTDAYASINVAGPRSRELMRRVAPEIDFDPERFPYMNVRRGRIAGVDHCFTWRIGFTGELSYEIHAPAGYGLHMWETLLREGADLGIAPFGVEAQRIMRLEKGHFIVGQDTDGLTKAHAAGAGGLVKLDKPDFAGRPELAWEREQGTGQRLVGLQPLDGAIVPPEASQILEGERSIAGRITSSRMSPTLGRSICLAVVAAHLAEPDTTVEVRLPDGRRIPARVTAHPAHYDPEGVRLRV